MTDLNEVEVMTGITDEMIEAAARALAVTPWDVAPDDLKRVIRNQAERVLRAGLAGRAVLDKPDDEQWFLFYGGPDPDNAAGCDLRDDETDAAEALEWTDSGHGAGIARRSVHYGPWEITQFKPGRDNAPSGVAGGGDR